MSESRPFHLLRQRRFAPLFATQFLGALNDNLLKVTTVLLVTFDWGKQTAGAPDVVLSLCNSILVLPFFLCSALAGQLADKFDKSWLIQRVKLFEIFAMLIAAFGFYLQSLPLLLATLFVAGLQSAFFGPLKHSILPVALKETELVGANALLETGTFFALLIGTVIGGLMVTAAGHGHKAVAVTLVAVATLGWITSRSVPTTAAGDPELKVRLNPAVETIRILRVARTDEVTFLAIMGTSWFWFYGVTMLTLLPTWTAYELFANESVVTLALTVFCVGIGAGALVCEELAHHRIELGLVPLGSIGMTLFAADLCFATPTAAHHHAKAAVDWLTFASSFGGARALFDLFAMSAFGGMYVVPLFALIQERAPVAQCARVIAANNVMNAAWIVASAALTMALGANGVSASTTFMLLALLNAFVALFIYGALPVFLLRFAVWALVHTLYRVRSIDADKLPADGPVVIVANHVTFVDGLIMSAVMKRHVRFVMDHNYANLPVLRYIVRKAGIIPIAPRRESKEVLEKAFETIAEALDNREVVCIFPEGKLTENGDMNAFRPGIEHILRRSPVPVLPTAFHGLWGSVFSRDRARVAGVLPKRFWSKITLVTGDPIPANEATAERLEEIVRQLRGSHA